MENIFFKYGIVLVGVVVIMLLISFAFSALDNTVKIPEKEAEKISGEKQSVIIEIEKLCDNCVKEKINQDCYIKEIETDSEIIQNDFSEGVALPENLSRGKNIIKVKSEDNVCKVIKME
ncbi:hypothetical protein JXB41_04015 [Candidatus Woesearchaeota archaeon]|nr:hypothetical protein [Candidatus Woesearchaeota archaeon]